MNICAVVPAAGRGTRLGGEGPKLLTQIGNGQTIWSILSRNLLAVAAEVNVVVSPEGEPAIREAVEREGLANRVFLSIQASPTGMGDAIFCGFPIWSHADMVLVVWGDQVFVSQDTMRLTCALHGGAARTVILPVVRLAQPYVEYVFSSDERLEAVRESREGDVCAPDGFGDIGTFALSVEGLRVAWTQYLKQMHRGAETAETNFLPFLPYLASVGWTVRRLAVTDQREARGINTPDDLEFFRRTLAHEPRRASANNT
ncbi:MAG TPA: NTP transferase domain-containing protein [Candidatus Binataceae bacterium]|nr:NTP transferase domain-containing protein [Candidatus Binataceae bacterium]